MEQVEHIVGVKNRVKILFQPLAIADIADFLTHGFNSGKQHSTINSYRSAISNTHPQIDGYPCNR
jgi:hypothetical protein